MNKVNVLGIAASHRNKAKREDILRIVKESKDFPEMVRKVNESAKNKNISNSECILTSSLFGAYTHNANVDLLRLNDCLPSIEPFKPEEINKDFFKKFESADGVCISTPVYFGDRSSYINSLYNELKRKYGELAFDGKVLGFVTVGAKRHGGQETTNIYSMYDSLNLGAMVVSNGPPSSQYGGTAWAGDAGVASEDDFGMATSFGTGRNIANVTTMIKNGFKDSFKKTIGIILTNDSIDGLLKNYFSNFIREFSDEGLDFLIIDLTEYRITRCKGCKKCPRFAGKPDIAPRQYGCITEDDMREVHSSLMKCDALILAGIESEAIPVRDMYQIFIERTRFIRRDNFQLTYTPTLVMGFSDDWRSNILPLRTITSFIRHNVVHIGPPIYFDIRGGMVHPPGDLETVFERFISLSSKIISFKRTYNIQGEDYIAIGYGDFEGKYSEDLLKTRIEKGKWLR
jgi:multimeric flavodoxin WrbA